MKKIVFADDNNTTLMYVGLLLKRFGFRVMPADDGLEALRLIKLTGADLVMLDVHMEHLDGIAVLRHIKEDKRTSYIPVIMLSADMNHEIIETCRKLGCHAFLQKPIKVDQLHAALQECFFSYRGTNRKHLRVSFNQKVKLTCQGKAYSLFSETLSEGGIYLRKEDPLPIGKQVSIVLELAQGESLSLKGHIIYRKELLGDFLTLPPGMAVQFSEVSAEAASRLKHYLETLIAGDIIEGQEQEVLER